jgi:DNA-binding transcriptional regulator YiaG
MKSNLNSEITRVAKETGSDEKLARALDVSVSTVRAWKKGKSFPNQTQLCKLVDTYNLTIIISNENH